MAMNDVPKGACGAFEQLEVTLSAGSLTSGSYLDSGAIATKAVIYVDSDVARIRYDGTAPTTSIGHAIQSGEELTIEGGGNIAALQVIAVNSTAQINVHYIR